MSDEEIRGEKRAFDEIASVLCECHFTDGFCNGRDRPDCKCNKLAAAALSAIKGRGVKKYLGCFKSPEEAREAYLKEAIATRGEFVRID